MLLKKVLSVVVSKSFFLFNIFAWVAINYDNYNLRTLKKITIIYINLYFLIRHLSLFIKLFFFFGKKVFMKVLVDLVVYMQFLVLSLALPQRLSLCFQRLSQMCVFQTLLRILLRQNLQLTMDRLQLLSTRTQGKYRKVKTFIRLVKSINK